MSDRKAPTIDLGKGINYAKVSSRLAEFHKDNDKDCVIETSFIPLEGFMVFKATVTTSKGVFTGHSMAKVGNKEKQFEKQETIAVGRALAFAGYLADGEIACAEEMADVVTLAQLNNLKQRFATVNSESLKDKDRPHKLQAFRSWCSELFLDESVDYTEASNWNREWYDLAWRSLQTANSDVPFDA